MWTCTCGSFHASSMQACCRRDCYGELLVNNQPSTTCRTGYVAQYTVEEKRLRVCASVSKSSGLHNGPIYERPTSDLGFIRRPCAARLPYDCSFEIIAATS